MSGGRDTRSPRASRESRRAFPVVAALHYFALALGRRALKGPLDRGGLRRVFAADDVWGMAAALWLATGLLRAFGGLDKGSAFYLASHSISLLASRNSSIA